MAQDNFGLPSGFALDEPEQGQETNNALPQGFVLDGPETPTAAPTAPQSPNARTLEGPPLPVRAPAPDPAAQPGPARFAQPAVAPPVTGPGRFAAPGAKDATVTPQYRSPELKRLDEGLSRVREMGEKEFLEFRKLARKSITNAAARTGFMSMAMGQRKGGTFATPQEDPSYKAFREFAVPAEKEKFQTEAGAIPRGVLSLRQGINTMGMEFGLIDPKTGAQNIARHEATKETYKAPKKIEEGLRAISEAKDFASALALIAKHPDAMISVVGESLGHSIIPSVGGTVAGGVVGGLPGAMVGGGLGSAAVEYTASILEILKRNGIDIKDSEAVHRAFTSKDFLTAAREKYIQDLDGKEKNRPKNMEEARVYAGKRAAAIGLFDTLTLGLSGKVASLAMRSGSRVKATGLAAGALGIEAAGGAGGEATAQYVTEGKLKPGEIVMEGVGEIVPGAGQVVGAAVADRQPQAGETPPPLPSQAEQPPPVPPVAQESPPLPTPSATPPPLPQEAAPQPEEVEEAPIREDLEENIQRSQDDDMRLLRSAGYTAEQVDDMDNIERSEIADDLRKGGQQAPPAGFEVDETPVAEPKNIPSPVAETGTPANPTPIETKKDLKAAEKRVETDPTDGQKEAGNYAKGHVKLHGLDISIETPKGATRSGVGADGKTWKVKSPASYGYVKRTEGADGDHVDVYIGDYPQSDKVFIIDQLEVESGRFDETKIILGANTAEQARDLYEKGFSDGKGAQRIGAFSETTVPEFKKWLSDGDTKQAYAGKLGTPRRTQDLESDSKTAQEAAPGQQSATEEPRQAGRERTEEAVPEGETPDRGEPEAPRVEPKQTQVEAAKERWEKAQREEAEAPKGPRVIINEVPTGPSLSSFLDGKTKAKKNYEFARTSQEVSPDVRSLLAMAAAAYEQDPNAAVANAAARLGNQATALAKGHKKASQAKVDKAEDLLRNALIDQEERASETAEPAKPAKKTEPPVKAAEQKTPAYGDDKDKAAVAANLEAARDGESLPSPEFRDWMVEEKYIGKRGQILKRGTEAIATQAQRLADQAAVEKRLADIPDDHEGQVAAYGEAMRAFNKAVVANNKVAAQRADQHMEDILLKANDGTRFGIAANEEPLSIIEANRAPLGAVPMWGQEGMFIVERNGVEAIMDHDGNVHATKFNSKFPSSTGYFSGVSINNDAVAMGKRRIDWAQDVLQSAIDRKDYDTKKPAPLVYPERVYSLDETKDRGLASRERGKTYAVNKPPRQVKTAQLKAAIEGWKAESIVPAPKHAISSKRLNFRFRKHPNHLIAQINAGGRELTPVAEFPTEGRYLVWLSYGQTEEFQYIDDASTLDDDGVGGDSQVSSAKERWEKAQRDEAAAVDFDTTTEWRHYSKTAAEIKQAGAFDADRIGKGRLGPPSGIHFLSPETGERLGHGYGTEFVRAHLPTNLLKVKATGKDSAAHYFDANYKALERRAKNANAPGLIVLDDHGSTQAVVFDPAHIQIIEDTPVPEGMVAHPKYPQLQFKLESDGTVAMYRGQGEFDPARATRSAVPTADLHAAFREALEDVRAMLPKSIQIKTHMDPSKPLGEFSNDIIWISLLAKDPAKYLRHEAVHALKSLGLITKAEWRVLVKTAEREQVLQVKNEEGLTLEERYRGVYAGEDNLDAVIQEEAVGNLLEQHIAGKKYDAKTDTVLGRLAEFIKQLGAALTGRKIESPDAVVGRLLSGEVAGRQGAARQKPQRLFALAGQRAQGAPDSQLAAAQGLLDRGKSAQQVWQATGWMQGKDGKWRFEIDDSQAKLQNLQANLKPNPAFGSTRSAPIRSRLAWLLGESVQTKEFNRYRDDKKAAQKLWQRAPKWAKQAARMGINVRLQDILSHPELFKAYPFLNQMRANIIISKNVPASQRGGALSFERRGDTVIYHPMRVVATDENDALDSILHEVQHYIQNVEGFSPGAMPNPNEFKLSADADPQRAFSPNTPLALGTARASSGDIDAIMRSLDRSDRISFRTPAERIAGDIKTQQQRIVDLEKTGPDRHDIANVGLEGARSRLQHDIEGSKHRLLEAQKALREHLRIGVDAYGQALGEVEAREVEARRRMTKAQRRRILPMEDAVGVDLGPAMTFKEAADIIELRLARIEQIERAWAEAVELEHGVTVARPDEDGLTFKVDDSLAFEVTLYPTVGSALLTPILETYDGYVDGKSQYTDTKLKGMSTTERRQITEVVRKHVRQRYNAADVVEFYEVQAGNTEIAFWKDVEPDLVEMYPAAFDDEVQAAVRERFGKTAVAYYEDVDMLYVEDGTNYFTVKIRDIPELVAAHPEWASLGQYIADRKPEGVDDKVWLARTLDVDKPPARFALGSDARAQGATMPSTGSRGRFFTTNLEEAQEFGDVVRINIPVSRLGEIEPRKVDGKVSADETNFRVPRDLAESAQPHDGTPYREPAVPIEDSVHPNYIVDLETGKKFRQLKRTLIARGETPESYRQKWGLPDDYPMVAANYSSERRRVAQGEPVDSAPTKELSKISLTMQVKASDTGETTELRLNAQEALNIHDKRIRQAHALKACLAG